MNKAIFVDTAAKNMVDKLSEAGEDIYYHHLITARTLRDAHKEDDGVISNGARVIGSWIGDRFHNLMSA